MSGSQSESRERTNFTEPGSNEYDPDREPLDDSKPEHSSETASSSGSSKDEWIALGILLDGARRYCYNCDEEREVETALEYAREHGIDPRILESVRDVETSLPRRPQNGRVGSVGISPSEGSSRTARSRSFSTSSTRSSTRSGAYRTPVDASSAEKHSRGNGAESTIEQTSRSSSRGCRTWGIANGTW